jgi:hypothetical protein
MKEGLFQEQIQIMVLGQFAPDAKFTGLQELTTAEFVKDVSVEWYLK